MHYKTHTFTASDGEQICYYKWDKVAEAPLRGVVQIAHGIGEHAARYDSIAQRLTENGFVVYANDHRAHGKTAEINRLYGHYDGDDYFEDAVDDMHTLSALMQKENPDSKFILFGHSMGSLLSRKYATMYGKDIDALILSGTASFIKGLGHFGLVATKLVTSVNGRVKGNETLRALFFDEFNKKFKPNRTKLDWLSRDEKAVDVFEADPYRIENFSLGVFADIISNSLAINKDEAFKVVPNKLPILIFSGDKDPVGEMGKGVKKVVNKFKKYGTEDMTLHLYKDGRHEMLNELNSQEVEQDIIDWLDAHIPKK